MKHTLILLAALLCGAAHAEVIAISSTKAGGEIRLTDQQSNCPADTRLFYTTTKGGEVMPGCWSLLDGDVFAAYRDGSVRLYSLDGFTVKQKPAAQTKQRGQSL